MFRYYFQLGIVSLRRNPLLTGLMVLTLAIGVAASVSTLTILHIMSGDPIPHKSNRLLSPVIDVGLMEDYVPGSPPDDPQMSYKDAHNLLMSKHPARRAAVFGITGGIESTRIDLPITEFFGLAVSADYFSMFEVPFLYGAGWSAADEEAHARVVVLSRQQSETLYGKENPVGKHIRFFDNDYQVIGVLNHWNPLPRYTHLINANGGSFDGEDQIYMPFSTAINQQINSIGSRSCHQGTVFPGYQGVLDSECTWLQFWFEVQSTSDIAALKTYLNTYAIEQKKLGRLNRPNPVKLYDVMAWMGYLKIVESDSKLSVWLSFGFLALCLVNAVGLLLAKFSKRAAEVGVRRALGATKAQIFKQFLLETSVVGLAGGLLGLPLSFLAIRVIANSSEGLSIVPQMDWFMLDATFLLSVTASIVAGLIPTWRACQTNPAWQLKSQ